MNTSPTDSTGPAGPDLSVPDAAGGPTVAEQAGADASAVLKGAARGGTAGAVRAALKTKTGRNMAVAAATVPVIAAALVIGLGFNAIQSALASPAGRSTMAVTAADASFENKEDLRRIRTAAEMTGSRWEVLAAIAQTAKVRGGTGPFGIDLGRAGGEISEADANDFDKAALYLGRKLAAASRDTVDTLPNPSLSVGMVDARGDKGEHLIKASNRDEDRAARALVKERYLAAINALPLAEGSEAAETVFTAAFKWASGQENKCEAVELTVGSPGSGTHDSKQRSYAQAIINQVAAQGLPERAAVIALATALQESSLQMYWNPHVPGSQGLSFGGPEGGKDLAPPQISYSVGLFQQQVNGSRFSWGTVEDAMSPSRSTAMFLNRLLGIPGWQDLPVTVAAQTVQVSAFPDAYADDEVTAQRLVGELKPTSGSYGTNTSPSGPGTVAGTESKFISTDGCLSLRPPVVVVASGVPGTGDDYPFREPVGILSLEADPWALYKRQCVSFVAWRMNQQMGWKEGQEYPFTPAKLGFGLFGNAVDWKHTVGSVYPMDQVPKPGAIAWFDSYLVTPSTRTGYAGHVAVVRAVNADGTVDLEEYNFTPSDLAYSTRTIPAADVSGFIHVADVG